MIKNDNTITLCDSNKRSATEVQRLVYFYLLFILQNQNLRMQY